MPDWKVLIADNLAPQAAEVLEDAGIQVDDHAGIDASDLEQSIPGYHGLIVRSRTKVTEALLQAAVSLKVVGRAGVGVDNIDLEAAKKKDIAIVNAPRSTSLAVAEHTLALMLSLVRKIPQADARMKAGEWPKKELRGTELAGKVLGIVGMGNIGSAVARRAAAFGMNVLGFDPFLDEETIQERGAKSTALKDVYRLAVIVTFHLPLNDDTRAMINSDALGKMKSGVFLIHTARGGVIDEAALLAALDSGQVAGAALDVFEEEPPGANALVTHTKVVATPHIGAQTAEAQTRSAQDVAEEVLAALEGRPLRWRVA